ncbi:MAG: sporulation integral membrane protein YlbJ [Bacillota bacterium]|jgi:sporulation integral membrane protein YlbJ|nr:sporulation integral membrane protein YlbJ [Clostridia bacterium]
MKILLPIGTILICVSMIVFPKETYEAATLGLNTWWTIVFPSLLPFFIIAELFLGLGIVHFIGILLEPVMRPIFNLPGSAAFVVALGYSSGFPIGAALTTSLRKQNLCTRLEGERLLSFTNNASPLFIFVAVSVGIFHDPSLGVLLATAHYLSNLLLGVLLRFYGTKDPEKNNREKIHYQYLLRRSFRAMFEAQKKDGRPLGKLMSDAVKKSVINLATIGGFIILFAVLIRILAILGISPYIEKIISLIFYPFHFSDSIITALSGGLFEMTLGVKMAGESMAPLSERIVAASMIMGWSGLCIQAQIAGIISESDLHFLPCFLTRIAHMLLAGFFTAILAHSRSIGVIKMLVPEPPVEPLSYVVIPFFLCILGVLVVICTVIFRILILHVLHR